MKNEFQFNQSPYRALTQDYYNDYTSNKLSRDAWTDMRIE